jgi:hypothetical protein
MLTSAGAVVGVNLAFYSERLVGGRPERFCNLAALCVEEDARPHTFRLLRAVLRQPGYHFTDLSPSGSVVELDRRLGFEFLDTTSSLVLNLPRPCPGVELVSDPEAIAALLSGPELAIYRDHRAAAAARHLVIRRGDASCYVMFRKARRKGLPVFASFLHVSDPDLFRSAYGAVAGHLLARHGALASLTEQRVVGAPPGPGRRLARSRPKAFKSATLAADEVDDLYSELVCVPW